MATVLSNYDSTRDFERLGHWLARTYRQGGPLLNWLQPRWEYMHFHPLIHDVDLSRIGIWEDEGEILGIVHPEHAMGQAYFQCHPDRAAPRAEMLAHAATHLRAADGRLRLFISDQDDALAAIAAESNFACTESCEVMSRLDIARASSPPALLDGLRLQSLAEENDLERVNRLLWRGFGHGEVPPDDGRDDREFMQSAPNYRHDLNLVIANERGDYIAYAGLWFEASTRIAYVEPVATDPEYRRRGLARVLVLEGFRRCAELGATVAYVGSDLPLYLALEFEPVARWSVWEKD